MASYWLLATMLLLAIGLGWSLRELLQMRRQQARLQARIDEFARQFRLQTQSISGLTAGAIGVDRRLRDVEARAQQLVDRQTLFENRQADERPYDHAIRMVQQGAGVRRLVEELELSESEADLIVRMHGDSPELKSVEI